MGTVLLDPSQCPNWVEPYVVPEAPLSSHSTMAVVNVRHFIDAEPAPRTSTSVREALRKAAASLPVGGGVLYFPEGVYEIDNACCAPIAIQSRTWVRGAGRGSILKVVPQVGQPPSGAALLSVVGVSDVTVSDLVFDLDNGTCDGASTSRNFMTAIACGSGVDMSSGETVPGSRITIENCLFMSSGDVVAAQTQHAILASGVDGLFIRDNHVIGLQIKAAGSEGGTRIFIENNHFEDPHNLAISVVMDKTPTPDSTAAVADVHITGNVVVNCPSAGGFFVGTDGQGTLGDALHRVIIRGNVLRGSFFGARTNLPCTGTIGGVGAAQAIIVDVPVSGLDVMIQDNVIENTLSPPADNTGGILVHAAILASTSLRSLVISGNTVRGFDQPGISVSCSAASVIIESNQIERARGIDVRAGPSGMEQLVITHNHVRQLQGIRVSSELGPLRRAQIHGNVITCDPGDHPEYAAYFTGIVLAGSAAFPLSADVTGNFVTTPAGKGIVETGTPQSFVQMRYLDNRLPDPSPQVQALVLLGTGAVLRRNQGYPGQQGQASS